jgi:hypothetical protein
MNAKHLPADQGSLGCGDATRGEARKPQWRRAAPTRPEGQQGGRGAIRERADAQALQLQPVLEEELRAEGITTLAGFVEAFNEGMQTPRGGQWHASSVRNLLARIGETDLSKD